LGSAQLLSGERFLRSDSLLATHWELLLTQETVTINYSLLLHIIATLMKQHRRHLLCYSYLVTRFGFHQKTDWLLKLNRIGFIKKTTETKSILSKIMLVFFINF
jgi:hypothetical protein